MSEPMHVEDAAKELGITSRSLRRYVKRGCPRVGVRSPLRVDVEAVRAWMEGMELTGRNDGARAGGHSVAGLFPTTTPTKRLGEGAGEGRVRGGGGGGGGGSGGGGGGGGNGETTKPMASAAAVAVTATADYADPIAASGGGDRRFAADVAEIIDLDKLKSALRERPLTGAEKERVRDAFALAKALRGQVDVESKQLELAKQRGVLIEREEAYAERAVVFAHVRDRVMQVAARCAEDVVALGGELGRVEARIEKECRWALTELST